MHLGAFAASYASLVPTGPRPRTITSTVPVHIPCSRQPRFAQSLLFVPRHLVCNTFTAHQPTACAIYKADYRIISHPLRALAPAPSVLVPSGRRTTAYLINRCSSRSASHPLASHSHSVVYPIFVRVELFKPVVGELVWRMGPGNSQGCHLGLGAGAASRFGWYVPVTLVCCVVSVSGRNSICCPVTNFW